MLYAPPCSYTRRSAAHRAGYHKSIYTPEIEVKQRICRALRAGETQARELFLLVHVEKSLYYYPKHFTVASAGTSPAYYFIKVAS